jgi:hypothetical protein
MHRIDDPTNVSVLPAPRPAGTPGYFTGGSPGTGGYLATRVRYEFMNAIQEELCAIAEAAGLSLDKTDNNQVLEALRKMLRFKLSQDEYLYIDPAGDDSNSGLSPATPFRTGQAAWNFALTLDLNNHNLILQFAHGTYTDPIHCAGRVLGLGADNGVVLQGDDVRPDLVIFATVGTVPCVTADDGAEVEVRGVTLQATGVGGSYQSQGAGVCADTGGYIAVGNVYFGQCDHSHMFSIGGGIIQTVGQPYRIMGNAMFHMIAAIGGYIANVNSPVSITGSPNFTAFVDAQSKGIVATYSVAYSGAASGSRYQVGTGGMIISGSADPNYLPGNLPGSVDAATFGLYL